MNILIVEDDDNIANVVSEILQAREFETVLCDTGSQAVELIKNNMYDLILLDVMLPGLDGFQVIRIILIDLEHQDKFCTAACRYRSPICIKCI